MTTSIPQQKKNVLAIVRTKSRVAEPSPHVAPAKVKPARKASGEKKSAPARRGTKTAKILDLLKRPGGVTLKELIKATRWQAHNVRGFLGGTIGKKRGTPVHSSKRADGERAYRLSSE
jgi:hypothetical protein